MLALLLFQANCQPGNYFVVGLLIGAVCGWLMKPSRQAPASPFVECPKCQEPVRAGATVCTHCHSVLAS